MKVTLGDLLKAVPARPGTGGGQQPSGGAASGPETAIDRTTANFRLLQDEEASARAEKTARLKSAREARDGKPQE